MNQCFFSQRTGEFYYSLNFLWVFRIKKNSYFGILKSFEYVTTLVTIKALNDVNDAIEIFLFCINIFKY